MIRKIRNLLNDPNLDLQSKSFVLLSSIALVGLFFAMVSGIVLGQSLAANLSVFAEFALFSILFYRAVYHGRIIQTGTVITAFLVFIFLPAAFFTSGGAAGGTPIWFMFTTLYIVLTMSGGRKTFFLAADFTVVAICWYIGYIHPETVIEFSRKEAYFDSFFTLLIVSIVMTLLINFRGRLFRRENERVNSQKKEIEELNQSQKRFFSSISHEIRTPINSILGLNEVILRQEDASEEIKNDANIIQGAGKMLLSLINDILDISKIEAGKMDIVPVRYSVLDMVTEIVNMVWHMADEKGLKFETDIDPNIPSALTGDEIRIMQIVINLLSNSVKYTANGSIRQRWETEDIAGDKDGVMLIIKISDTGMGIKPEVIPTLFDAFRREDLEKNRRIEGTGLGLSIVKQLVDLMGGQITVESVYKEGSTFTVRIPQQVSDPAVIGKITVTGHSGFKNTYKSRFTAPDADILIVDDVKMNLTVETKLLRDTKVRVDTATSGEEALEKTRNKKYDVILMDHFMPGMDGIECLSRIREQTWGMCSEVPVIVLTANAAGENQELYRSVGFDAFLVKPISGIKLEEALLRFIPPEKIIKNMSVSDNENMVE
ncbi:MAG: response regulator [Lachnospiraceae bacterium]|nr:response regulator [Lachnospiraceae bacterium]